jgi:hypothetical protein
MLKTLHPNERDCNSSWHPNLRVHKTGCARSGVFTSLKTGQKKRRARAALAPLEKQADAMTTPESPHAASFRRKDAGPLPSTLVVARHPLQCGALQNLDVPPVFVRNG